MADTTLISRTESEFRRATPAEVDAYKLLNEAAETLVAAAGAASDAAVLAAFKSALGKRKQK